MMTISEFERMINTAKSEYRGAGEAWMVTFRAEDGSASRVWIGKDRRAVLGKAFAALGVRNAEYDIGYLDGAYASLSQEDLYVMGAYRTEQPHRNTVDLTSGRVELRLVWFDRA